MKVNESVIHKLLLVNPGKLLKNLTVSSSEFRLITAMDILNREVNEGYKSGTTFGKIDLILRYRSMQYVTEIKYNVPTNTSSDFWDSLKVLGYYEYYKWQTGITNKVRPAVILPLYSVKLEQQIIAGKLNIAVFGFYEEKSEPKLKLLDDRPVWKQ